MENVNPEEAQRENINPLEKLNARARLLVEKIKNLTKHNAEIEEKIQKQEEKIKYLINEACIGLSRNNKTRIFLESLPIRRIGNFHAIVDYRNRLLDTSQFVLLLKYNDLDTLNVIGYSKHLFKEMDQLMSYYRHQKNEIDLYVIEYKDLILDYWKTTGEKDLDNLPFQDYVEKELTQTEPTEDNA